MEQGVGVETRVGALQDKSQSAIQVIHIRKHLHKLAYLRQQSTVPCRLPDPSPPNWILQLNSLRTPTYVAPFIVFWDS